MAADLSLVIRQSAELGAAAALEHAGLTSGEMSFRRARDTYGKWFTDAVRRGAVRPVRIEDGGVRRFSVTDILAARTADAAAAYLRETTNTQHHQL